MSGGQSLARRPVGVTDRRASWPITRGKVWGSARPRTVKLCVTDLGSRRSAQRVAAHRSPPARAFGSRARATRTGLTMAHPSDEAEFEKPGNRSLRRDEPCPTPRAHDRRPFRKYLTEDLKHGRDRKGVVWGKRE